MKTVTQTMLYRQAIIQYAEKHGVTKAAIRYKTNRQYIYRCAKDMTENCNRWQTNRIDRITIQTSIQSNN